MEIQYFSSSDAIVLIRAPQFSNKFEKSSVTFEGNTVDDLTTFVKENLWVSTMAWNLLFVYRQKIRL